MRFTLVDRVLELTPGSRITAVKNVSLAEEYLADHFPLFPVMPGVLMLEAMTQTSAWLVRASEDFAHSVVVLKEARNVRYADFVQPGGTLTLSAEVVKHDERYTELKANGVVADRTAVSGRIVLERFNLSSEGNSLTDELVKQKMRELWALLYRPQVQAAEAAHTG